MDVPNLGIKLPSPVAEIVLPHYCGTSSILLKRDDLIHPVISGNKYRKLLGHLPKITSPRYRGVLSFGGVWSNHLHALAYICNMLEVPLVAIIRGQEYVATDTVRDLEKWGATIVRITRSQYAKWTREKLYDNLKADFPHHYFIPEGGGGYIDGIAQVWQELVINNVVPEVLVCPLGTGATFLGLLRSKPEDVQLIGVSSLKNVDWYQDLELKESAGKDFQIWNDYHFGGFGKCPAELLQFMNDFQSKYGIPLDSVYTSKMMYGLEDKLSQLPDLRGKRIVALHTGGLQGNRSRGPQKR